MPKQAETDEGEIEALLRALFPVTTALPAIVVVQAPMTRVPTIV